MSYDNWLDNQYHAKAANEDRDEKTREQLELDFYPQVIEMIDEMRSILSDADLDYPPSEVAEILYSIVETAATRLRQKGL